MKRNGFLGMVAAVLAGALLVGCETDPVQLGSVPETGPLAAKASAAHSLVFVEPVDDADPAIRLFGDGRGEYVPAQDGSEITVERQFIFRPEGSGGKPVADPRRLCLRFTEDQEVTGAGIPDDLADDLDETGRTCARGDIRTVWHSNGDLGLEAMALGETIRAEARYIWTDGENNQFKLEFFCRDDRGGDDGTTACENLVDVTLVEETATSRTWRLSFDPTRVAPLSRNFVKGPPSPFEVLAAFHMPFDLTVTKSN